jgi:3-oxoacyl-[acyl-carrier protein] reductase
MNLGLVGRVAVVTGGTRGIGAAVSELLEGEGARVIRAARSNGVDVTDPGAPDRVTALAGGPIDILVNNAGTSGVRGIDQITDAEWELQWQLNVLGPMRLMRALAPGMAQRGWGRIVNVSSSSGKRPSTTNAAYSVTKAAQLSLSRVFADEYAGTGVNVNAVTPGAVAGPLWLDDGGMADQIAAAKGMSRDEALAAQAQRIPIGRLLGPREVASVIAFLCSEAASGVTGASWSADGGTVPGII